MTEPALVFLVPTEHLGRVEDVRPERLSPDDNQWLAITREQLKKKKARAASGHWKPTVDLSEEKQKLGAEHCPAMHELESIGFLLKWPATAILKNVSKAGWMLKPSTNFNFYDYHPATSFPEFGEAEVISVDVGWLVVTPPGWSVMIKNVPNNLRGSPDGLVLAEGIVRTDRATTPLRTHAFIRPGAPKEIKIKRGEPMAVLYAFERKAVDLAILDDRESVEEAERLAKSNEEAFRKEPGVYRRLYVEAEGAPTPLYAKLLEKWKASRS